MVCCGPVMVPVLDGCSQRAMRAWSETVDVNFLRNLYTSGQVLKFNSLSMKIMSSFRRMYTFSKQPFNMKTMVAVHTDCRTYRGLTLFLCSVLGVHYIVSNFILNIVVLLLDGTCE